MQKAQSSKEKVESKDEEGLLLAKTLGEEEVLAAREVTETRAAYRSEAAEDPSRYCPVCSQRLESRRCKLICTVCGYYMSCADYY